MQGAASMPSGLARVLVGTGTVAIQRDGEGHERAVSTWISPSCILSSYKKEMLIAPLPDAMALTILPLTLPRIVLHASGFCDEAQDEFEFSVV